MDDADENRKRSSDEVLGQTNPKGVSGLELALVDKNKGGAVVVPPSPPPK